MTEAALRTEFALVIDWFTSARSAANTNLSNALAALNDTDELDADAKARVAQIFAQHRQQMAQIIQHARDASMPYLAKYGKSYFNSRYVSGNRVTNPRAFFREMRKHFVDNTIYVTARAASYGNNPSDDSTGLKRRLTVDSDGETIESGMIEQTVRGVIEGTEAGGGEQDRWRARVYGASPEQDRLPDGAGGGQIVFPSSGPEDDSAVICDNPQFGGNGSTSDGNPITAVTDWDITETGNPDFLVDTTNKWRGQSYGLSVGGDNAEVLLEQDIGNLQNQNGEIPLGIMVPIYMNGAGWAGDITITWGGKTQAYTEADLSNGAWTPLFVDFDKDLYGVNWEATDSKFKLDIDNDPSLSGAEVVLGGFYPILARRLVPNEGPWYYYWANESDAVLRGTFAWSADTNNQNGDHQEFFAVVWGEYLRSTASGTAWT